MNHEPIEDTFPASDMAKRAENDSSKVASPGE